MRTSPSITKTKDHIIIKIPNEWARFGYQKRAKGKTDKEMTEERFLKIVEQGEKEYREGKAKIVGSLKEFLSS